MPINYDVEYPALQLRLHNAQHQYAKLMFDLMNLKLRETGPFPDDYESGCVQGWNDCLDAVTDIRHANRPKWNEAADCVINSTFAEA